MKTLLSQLQISFPELSFVAGDQFYWSPETKTVYYLRNATGQRASWSLLHETGHGILGHTSYAADFELLRLEVAAWEQAITLATSFNITIDPNHIQDCLDTYREWLYKRSICPNCTAKCLQQDDHVHYHCFNCHTVWKVSANRFGRSYRATEKQTHRTAAFHTHTTQ